MIGGATTLYSKSACNEKKKRDTYWKFFNKSLLFDFSDQFVEIWHCGWASGHESRRRVRRVLEQRKKSHRRRGVQGRHDRGHRRRRGSERREATVARAVPCRVGSRGARTRLVPRAISSMLQASGPEAGLTK